MTVSVLCKISESYTVSFNTVTGMISEPTLEASMFTTLYATLGDRGVAVMALGKQKKSVKQCLA